MKKKLKNKKVVSMIDEETSTKRNYFGEIVTIALLSTLFYSAVKLDYQSRIDKTRQNLKNVIETNYFFKNNHLERQKLNYLFFKSDFLDKLNHETYVPFKDPNFRNTTLNKEYLTVKHQ